MLLAQANTTLTLASLEESHLEKKPGMAGTEELMLLDLASTTIRTF